MIALSNQQQIRGELGTETLPTVPRLRVAKSLDQHTFHRVRQRAILEGCKWDPQVGDVSTLAPFPLILSHVAWRELARMTER